MSHGFRIRPAHRPRQRVGESVGRNGAPIGGDGQSALAVGAQLDYLGGLKEAPGEAVFCRRFRWQRFDDGAELGGGQVEIDGGHRGTSF